MLKVKEAIHKLKTKSSKNSYRRLVKTTVVHFVVVFIFFMLVVLLFQILAVVSTGMEKVWSQ